VGSGRERAQKAVDAGKKAARAARTEYDERITEIRASED